MPAESNAKKKPTASSRGLLNVSEGSYIESTSRPLYALLFLLPWIVIYELGTLWVNTEQVGQILTRKCVIAFIWLTKLAQWMQLQPRLVWLFPGFVVVVILLCWHIATGRSWRVRFKWLGGMAVESVLFAVPLMFINAAIGSSTRAGAFAAVFDNPTVQAYLDYIVTGIGAGIYEELVFRLILVGLLLVILEDLIKLKTHLAVIIAVTISAVLFAAHHYFGFVNGHLAIFQHEPFTMSGFLFRTAAGVYFAILFHYRGFGITAGAHAAYDIILKTLWS